MFKFKYRGWEVECSRWGSANNGYGYEAKCGSMRVSDFPDCKKRKTVESKAKKVIDKLTTK